MKNKYRHGKLVGGLTMGLVAVSLVTVGFSAWVIAAKTTSDEVPGISVDIADVVDKTVVLQNAAIDGKNGTVLFDASNDDGGSITSDTNNEDLTFVVNFDVVVNDLTSFKGVSVSAKEAKKVLGQFVTDKYIVAPFIFTVDPAEQYVPLVDGDWLAEPLQASRTVYYDASGAASLTSGTSKASAKVDISKSGTTYSFKVTYSFAWGELFGGVNPVLEQGTAKIEDLKKLKSEPVTFDLTLKHDPAAKVDIA